MVDFFRRCDIAIPLISAYRTAILTGINRGTLPETPLRVVVATQADAERMLADFPEWLQAIKEEVSNDQNWRYEAAKPSIARRQAFDRYGEALQAVELALRDCLPAAPYRGAWKDIRDQLLRFLDILAPSAFSSAAHQRFAHTLIAATRAGWVILDGVGCINAPILTIYPLPGLAAPVPQQWIADSATVAAAVLPPLRAIDLATLPTPDLPSVAPATWKDLIGLPPKTAAKRCLERIGRQGGDSSARLAGSIARYATAITIESNGDECTLVLVFARLEAELRLAAPWTGSLAGLPPDAAGVLRQHNGMVYRCKDTIFTWNVYEGFGKGFRNRPTFREYEVDKHLWRCLLAPLSFGETLHLAYHPTRRHRQGLCLVRLSGGRWVTPVSEQHPGMLFLREVDSLLKNACQNRHPKPLRLTPAQKREAAPYLTSQAAIKDFIAALETAIAGAQPPKAALRLATMTTREFVKFLSSTKPNGLGRMAGRANKNEGNQFCTKYLYELRHLLRCKVDLTNEIDRAMERIMGDNPAFRLPAGTASSDIIRNALRRLLGLIKLYGFADPSQQSVMDGLITAVRAAWIPIDVMAANTVQPMFVVYPIPGLAAPIPEGWSQAYIAPPPRRAIDRSTLPVVDLPLAPDSGWAKLVALPTEQAALAIFAPMTANGRDSGPALAEELARRALNVRRGGSTKHPCLEVAFESGVLTLDPPWTGSLIGLPPFAASVVRCHNGMRLQNGTAAWHVYRGPDKGFAFEWGVWEVNDNDDGIWKRAPLAPCTNGQDLFLYHPAQIKNGTLELMFFDHEGGDPEPTEEQHPGVHFFNSVLTWVR